MKHNRGKRDASAELVYERSRNIELRAEIFQLERRIEQLEAALDEPPTPKEVAAAVAARDVALREDCNDQLSAIAYAPPNEPECTCPECVDAAAETELYDPECPCPHCVAVTEKVEARNSRICAPQQNAVTPESGENG